MQGFGAKKYDLPAPYGLKPRKGKKHLKKMDKLAKNYFTTPQRKLIGYLLLLILAALLILQVVRIVKPNNADVAYELDGDTGDSGAVGIDENRQVLKEDIPVVQEKKNVVNLDALVFDEAELVKAAEKLNSKNSN
ncbi:hypothetical protein FOA43_004801 [Brettanomyces nanus]|uniref:Uncharacterized protein n=1 Tax=Eeniella nana TaxID=13502 RepID=A0A875S936_EENNA|nr:uncharacterized protein FOA43_004801 [Brettanomyces nanus]QPG77388.1 hypothetical protein FOA43_004801 [Brettanomyces nanus]